MLIFTLTPIGYHEMHLSVVNELVNFLCVTINTQYKILDIGNIRKTFALVVSPKHVMENVSN